MMLRTALLVLLLRLHGTQAEFTCPYDFTLFNGKCYSFMDEPTDILTARVVCETIGSELVSIHSEEEASFIVSSHLGYESWIGLYCNGWDENWEWTDATSVDYANFADQTSNTENCREVPETQRFGLRDDLLWWKREWSVQLNFTCERAPISCPDGFSFLTNAWCYASNSSVIMDYGNATNYCADLGAYLPSDESSEVSKALITAMKLDVADNMWIGLECSQATTTWYWQDHADYGPSQANFADPISSTTCQPYSLNKYALNGQGRWTAFKFSNQLPYVLCMTSALPMPTEAPDIAHCPEGYAKFRGNSPEEDWCFAMNHPLPLSMNTTADYDVAKEFCESRGELLPIVTSSAMTIFLRSIRASFDIVRKNPFWIALECGKDGSWAWSDGTPLDPAYRPWYGNTEDPCDGEYRCIFNEDGKWEQIPHENGQKLIMCAVRASTSTDEPVRPTQPESPDCPPGMHELTEKWCGVYSEPGSWTWSAAANYCAVNGYGSLPSVENEELAAALMQQRQDYVGTDQEAFWIGLLCAPDDQEFNGTGVWSWLDGTSWNEEYTMFFMERDNCTMDDTRYVFNSLERWLGIDGEANSLGFAVCTAPKINWFTTITTEAPAPIFRCDLNWLELYPGLCYSISNTVANYDGAVKYCGDRNALLPSIQSPKVTDSFMDILKHLEDDSTGFWIGLECDDEGNFQWADGAEVHYLHFPDINTKNCVPDPEMAYIYDLHSDWVLTSVDDLRYMVCEKPAYEEVTTPPPVTCSKTFNEISGQCFSFAPAKTGTVINYEQALDACDMIESHLPSIADPLVNAKLEYGAKGNMVWLGIHCENGRLAWDDGSSMLFQNFDPKHQQGLSCDESDADLGYVLQKDGVWRSLEKSEGIGLLVCMKQGTPYIPTSPTIPTTTTTATTTVTKKLTTKKGDGGDPSSSSEETDDPDDPPPTKTTKKTKTTTMTPTPEPSDSPLLYWWEWVLIAVAIVLGLLVIILAVLFIRYYCKKKGIVAVMTAKIVEEGDAVRKKSSRYAAFPKKEDDWEIDRRFVLIDYDTRLGQGAFGSVYQGRVLHKNLPPGASRSIMEMSALKKGNDYVAVKMLHESADKSAEMEFRDEIDLMKTIGYHERLVNMLACVSDSEPVMLIIEYCPNGDLLKFMRDRRMYMLEHDIDRYVDTTMIITQRKQLMFAMQIAYGMEYLSSRGFVHRDIAARNILIDHKETCKIGDFGLCRVIGKESEHYHSRGGRLPLKWMSPEAIAKYDFSPASDAWSFGVLLFEIITLGGSPYPDWVAAELLQRLRRGERMGRPDNCTDAMHELMHECWRADPVSRPVFSTLRKKLALQLEQVSPDEYYLKLNAQANYYAASSQMGEEGGGSEAWVL